MMNWLYYLLEANLYLILFYGFYRLFLHQETFYVLNRYYLIVSSAVSFLIPFLKLGFLVKEIIIKDQPVYQQIQVEKSLVSNEIAFFLYSLVALIFLLKIVWGFRHIFKLLEKTDKTVENGITIIKLRNTKTAFSFFNMLFIDPDLPQKSTILKHELAHIHQKHSIDILFFEIVRSLNWFNPIVHFLKNDIKLLHEYLADEETTKKGIEKYDYAIFLIQNSYGDQTIQLTNQIFNSSILKKRISMLNQKKSAKWARLRLLLVLPVVGGMLCTSTMAFTKNYGVVELFPNKGAGLSIQLQDTVKKTKAKEIVIAEPIPQVKKVKGVKLVPPPPPPVEPAPKAKSAKRPMKSVAPPPPPIEPKPEKGEVLKIKLSPPPPPAEPAPAKKKYDKDDVVYGDPTPSEKISGQVKDAVIKEIKIARLKKAGENK